MGQKSSNCFSSKSVKSFLARGKKYTEVFKWWDHAIGRISECRIRFKMDFKDSRMILIFLYLLADYYSEIDSPFPQHDKSPRKLLVVATGTNVSKLSNQIEVVAVA